MGMYTRLNLTCIVDKADEKDLEILRTMVERKGDIDIPSEKDHPLFHTERWKGMLHCCSAYFDHFPYSHLVKDNGIPNWYYFAVDCDLKNYDEEIEKFIDWIKPLSRTKGFVGYWQYEEDDEPHLIYF